MAAADDVVGMEDAEPRHLAGIGFGYGRAGLGSEEGAGFLKVRGSEGHAGGDHFVPDSGHGGEAFFLIGADLHRSFSF